MNGTRLTDAALNAYPTWWRDRYVDEVRAVVAGLLGDGRSGIGVTCSLLAGACRTRISARGMPKVYDLWAARTRASIVLATVPWMVLAPVALYAVGGSGPSQLRSPGGRVLGSGFDGLSVVQIVRPHHLAAGHVPTATWVTAYAATTVGVLFLVTLAVLAGGWTTLRTAIRSSHAPDRQLNRWLARAPGLSVLADVMLWFARAFISPHSWVGHGGEKYRPVGGFPAAAHALGIALSVVAVAGWAAAVVCVVVVSRRVQLVPADLRSGRRVSTMVAVLAALFGAAFATWAAAIVSQPSGAPGSTLVTVALDHGPWLVPVGVALVGIVALSWSAAVAARHSFQVALSAR